MTNKQLKNLKDTLWTTADQLRANSGLKSTEYAEPILGLIFLRFADVKYSKFEPEIKAEFDSIKGTRMEGQSQILCKLYFGARIEQNLSRAVAG